MRAFRELWRRPVTEPAAGRECNARRSSRLLLSLGAVTAITATATAATVGTASADDFGPDTCRQGYVWREATPTDRVCVTPAVRSQTRADNRAAVSRRAPGGDPFDPDTCMVPYVWREAVRGDHVCVTTATRARAARDNALAADRKVAARLWKTNYTIPPRDNGDGTGTGVSTDDIPRIKLNGDHYNFGEVRLYIRYNFGRLAWSGTVTARPQPGHAGGAWGVRTGLFDCSRADRPNNAYARARDVVSGRWSPRLPLSIGCPVF
ncbi:hypothetical protein ACFFMN_01780 [Planobispora siamensis]|uniref:Uncharacterized protein n=1 Tax=Planobispora siamensis TaxID=936338 RepID=A0A8J3SK46_9ACTN|nr:hypothetical protein [Planobispora siamensis]GIH95752.1 hypothetical protein Psi01_63820 [Planobispora siamensis]